MSDDDQAGEKKWMAVVGIAVALLLMAAGVGYGYSWAGLGGAIAGAAIAAFVSVPAQKCLVKSRINSIGYCLELQYFW